MGLARTGTVFGAAVTGAGRAPATNTMTKFQIVRGKCLTLKKSTREQAQFNERDVTLFTGYTFTELLL